MPNSGSKPSNSRSLLSVAGQNVRENVPLEAKPSSSRGFPDKMTGKMSGEIFQAASGGSPRASDPPTPPRHTSCAPPPVRLAQGRPLPDRIAQLPEPFEGGVFHDGFVNSLAHFPFGLSRKTNASASWFTISSVTCSAKCSTSFSRTSCFCPGIFCIRCNAFSNASFVPGWRGSPRMKCILNFSRASCSATPRPSHLDARCRFSRRTGNRIDSPSFQSSFRRAFPPSAPASP